MADTSNGQSKVRRAQTIPTTGDELRRAALQYAELGYQVYPLAPRAKVPPKGSRGLLDATTDAQQIERWWQEQPASNIGMRTDGLVVIDVDMLDNGPDPRPNPWLTDERARMLARAPLQRTGSGERQYIFRQPADRAYRSTDSAIAPNVNTQANDGYIVVAPSFVCRDDRTGRYAWVPGCELEMEPDKLPEPPLFLIEPLDAINANQRRSERSFESVLPVKTGQIPVELREERQWLLWNLERRGNDKPTKIPYQTKRRQKASADKPNTWTTYTSAVTAYETGGYSGIGFVFTPDDPYCGIDLDNCRDPETGASDEWAQKIIDECGSYSEISPSGTGVKIFCRAKLPSNTGKRHDLGGGKRIELYDHGRYFAVTGNKLPACPTECRDCQLVIHSLWLKYFAPKTKNKANGQAPYPGNGRVHDARERCGSYIARMPAAI